MTPIAKFVTTPFERDFCNLRPLIFFVSRILTPSKICTKTFLKVRIYGTLAVSFAVRCESFGGCDPETLTCNEIFSFGGYSSSC